MGHSENLFALGLLPAWSATFYVLLTSLFVLMRRFQLSILTTFLFTVYWGFLLYWAGFLSESSAHLMAFTAYVICSFAITSLTVIAYFQEST